MTSPAAEMGIVKAVRQISDGCWDVSVQAPFNALHSRAGQFVHVRVGEGFNPFLRRPLSVGPCREGRLRLIFTVRGRGTRLLTGSSPGDKLDIIGPLGNPYQMPDEDEVAVMVAGGIGIVPLLLLDDQMSPKQERMFIAGFRSGSLLTVDGNEATARRIRVATDDGSMGFHGTAVALLQNCLAEYQGKRPFIYACGPGPMMAAMKKFCSERGIRAQVSLEVPMGCGLGACQSCAVPRADGKGYLLVCHDGPVFDINDVDLTPENRP